MRRGIFNALERSSSYFFPCNCLTLKVKALPFPPSSPQASFTLPRFRLRIEIKMVARLSISTTFPHISIHFGRFARKSIRPTAFARTLFDSPDGIQDSAGLFYFAKRYETKRNLWEREKKCLLT